jgi:hypothetical protein
MKQDDLRETVGDHFIAIFDRIVFPDLKARIVLARMTLEKVVQLLYVHCLPLPM